MSERTAELVMALAMAAFSLFLMWESAKLDIGWVPGFGPGSGAWSFWLSVGMLICCAFTLVRWALRRSPESQSDEPFMDRKTLEIFLVTTIALAVMLGLVHFIGMYFAVMLLLLFYVRMVGRHTWTTTLALSIGLPIGLFFFFEATMKILLPKGYSEPLFYPLYKLIF